MPFFKKKIRAVLHLNKNEATLVDLSSGNKTSFSFTTEILQNLEIANVPALQQRVRILKDKSGIKKGMVIMVLSDDFLFTHNFSTSHPQDLQRDIKEFIKKIPFEEEKIVYKQFTLGGNTLAIATNKMFFKVVMEAFSEKGWDINYVVPETIFALLGDSKSTNTFNIQEADKFLYENPKLIKKLNFIDKDILESQSKIAPHPSLRTKVLVGSLVATVLVLLLAAGYVINSRYYNFTDKLGIKLPSISFKKDTSESESGNKGNENTNNAEEANNQNTDNVDITDPVDEEGFASIDLGFYRLQVLNGSGVSGLASTTRDELGVVGFDLENIEVGNAELTQITQVTHTPTTSEAALELLKVYLEEKYIEVEFIVGEENSTDDTNDAGSVEEVDTGNGEETTDQTTDEEDADTASLENSEDTENVVNTNFDITIILGAQR